MYQPLHQTIFATARTILHVCLTYEANSTTLIRSHGHTASYNMKIVGSEMKGRLAVFKHSRAVSYPVMLTSLRASVCLMPHVLSRKRVFAPDGGFLHIHLAYSGMSLAKLHNPLVVIQPPLALPEHILIHVQLHVCCNFVFLCILPLGVNIIRTLYDSYLRSQCNFLL